MPLGMMLPTKKKTPAKAVGSGYKHRRGIEDRPHLRAATRMMARLKSGDGAACGAAPGNRSTNRRRRTLRDNGKVVGKGTCARDEGINGLLALAH
jgi:hypothetical protein